MTAALSNTAAGFAQLPEVHFTTRDTAKVEEAVITIYEGLAKTTLYPGDPVRVFLTTLASVVAQRNIILDQTGRLNLLRYAVGPFLDHIGAMLDCPRLGASRAETTMRFRLLRQVNYQIIVPQGTRVTADAQIHFRTTKLAVIEPYALHIDILVEAVEPGAAANGLVQGQVNKPVDPVDGIVRVENLSTTTGGADVEKDEEYRERIHLAPEKFTCAGSELSYIYFAKTAHSAVGDVSVHSPAPGVVEVYVLLKGGLAPLADGPEITAVTDALSGQKVRPLTDQVLVLPARPIALDYQFRYFLHINQAGIADSIRDSLVAADREYRAWQTGKIGRDINPDRLVEACRLAGAKRIVPEIVTRNAEGEVSDTTPMVFTELNNSQVAHLVDGHSHSRVIFGGLEED